MNESDKVLIAQVSVILIVSIVLMAFLAFMTYKLESNTEDSDIFCKSKGYDFAQDYEMVRSDIASVNCCDDEKCLWKKYERIE